MADKFAAASELHKQGKFADAERLYREILRESPQHADAWYSLGILAAQHGRLDEARGLVEKAIAAAPDSYIAHTTLGSLLHDLGRLEEAVRRYDAALALRPAWVDAWNNRGITLLTLRRPAEALESFERALAVKPELLEAMNNRGIALQDLGRHEAAVESFDRALRIKPAYVDALSNRARSLLVLNRYADALASYDQALAAAPGNASVRTNRIFCLDFMPELGFAEHQRARREWFEAHASRIAAAPPPIADADPERALVVGYVSADFKRHSAAATFGPVLRRHDRRRFRVILYSGVLNEDERTQEFKQLGEWRPVAALSDEALAAQVRADRVDILVDLSGHSEGNRLLALASKPAPVQVTAWGHATGTGLPAIDYLFSDAVLIPAEARPLFAETVHDLPCCIGFEAPADAPPVAELPAAKRGFVTFGCLNRYSKVLPAVLALWARILHAVPGSRLLLKDTALGDAAMQKRVREDLAKLGIAPGRVELRGGTPRLEHLAAYHDVDIALDPFPQNGGVTTWEALWMGVPVLAKLGESIPSRLSGAILAGCGLRDWVVDSEEAYLAAAAARASDPGALATLRRGLRERILASSAGNPDLYTRAVEDAYRAFWKRRLAA
jgi:predicted O-linked N-acetylglucosamine transferase (SPINDLY family)